MDLGSSVLSLAGDSVNFLSANNTRVLAHHGSDVTLQCQVDKPPNSAMVRHTYELCLANLTFTNFRIGINVSVIIQSKAIEFLYIIIYNFILNDGSYKSQLQ